MYRSTVVIVLHTHPICPRHPGCESIAALWEVIRRQAADLFSWESHPRAFFMARPRITEVSLSPTSVIAASGGSPDYAYRFYRSPRSRVLAHLRFGSTSRSMQVTYLMKWIFSCGRSFRRILSSHYSIA